MACELWTEKIDAFADGELSDVEERSFEEHRRGCPSCAADAADRLRWKRAVRQAATRYVGSAAFRRRVEENISAKRGLSWRGRLIPVFASAAILLMAALIGTARWETLSRRRTIAELVDLHVSMLASSAPVDVQSSDRHTVKPWFAGRIPFSFDLPDLAGSPFSLLGGRLAFLNQEAGAQLVVQARQHRASVFIFPERVGAATWLGMEQRPTRQAAFNVETWTSGGLRYFAISDVAGEELHRLAETMREASQ